MVHARPVSGDLEKRLRAALARHGATLSAVAPLHGGACQDNYRVDVVLDGAPLRLALRSDAKGSLPGSVDRRQEFAVVEAAVGVGVKTPRARWLEADLVREGAHAYFMDWASGEALGRRVVRNPELSAARATLADELGRCLARLHTITPATHGHLPLPSPHGSPAAAGLDLLARMLGRTAAPAPGLEFCLAWLRAHAPTDEPVVLVHGDFRTGNFLVAPDGLAAVLDWEFAHFGSAYEDLAWLSVRDWRFGQRLPVGGFATRAALADAYVRHGGRPVDARHLLWWEIFGNVRWAVGSLFQGERYLAGEKDLELIAIAKRSTEMEFEALRLITRGALDD